VISADDARRRFAAEKVARLATIGVAGTPHLVPVVFAVADDTIYSAVDAKPKTTTALQRLANVRANPQVCVLVDHYDDADWTALWWVRADGTARILDLATDASNVEARRAIELLVARYPQYRDQPPLGAVLAIDVDRWTGWDSSG
jgi:PPOX class probable F420-dependent enzyme